MSPVEPVEPVTDSPLTHPEHTDPERTDPDEARHLTAEQVARALSISRSTAYRLMHEMGRIRVGRVVRVSRASFETWLAAHTETERREKAKRTGTREDLQLTLGFKERR